MQKWPEILRSAQNDITRWVTEAVNRRLNETFFALAYRNRRTVADCVRCSALANQRRCNLPDCERHEGPDYTGGDRHRHAQSRAQRAGGQPGLRGHLKVVR